MQRILVVIGTRPEAIKMAPLVSELRSANNPFQPIVCVTGQHRQMLDQALSLFDIAPDIDLNLMRPDQSLTQITASLLQELDRVMDETAPGWVLAQGDTTTVMAASLAAFYRKLRFGHVEAGLRTGDLQNPFPEELNRRIADLSATAWFAPTDRSRDSLLAEGADPARVFVTGNTVIDALLKIASQEFDWNQSPLSAIPENARLVVVTAHRRESIGEPLREICKALRELARRYEDQNTHFVYPVHLNPNIRNPVKTELDGIPNISLLEPLDYRSMTHLMKRAALILTDSGGIQEEAPSLGAPVLVVRETTERPEGIEAGVAKLIGAKAENIVRETANLLDHPENRAAMASRVNPYGDGKASRRIVDALSSLG
jgi:UDP-N-acetylglucosamine 2-epimerase (non-hydrolysing)